MKAGRAYLWWFFIINFALLLWPLAVSFGFGANRAVFYVVRIGQLSTILLLWAAIRAYRRRALTPPMSPALRLGMTAMGVLIVLLTGYGLLRGEAIYWIAADMWIFLIFLCFVALGRHDEVWDDLMRMLVVLFWIGFGLVLLGLGRVGSGSWDVGITGGAIQDIGERGTGTAAYDIRYVLWLWPILFAWGYLQAPAGPMKLAALAVAPACLALQIVSFKFRADVGLIMLEVVTVVVVLPALQRKLKPVTAVLVVLGLLIAFGALAGSQAMVQFTSRFAEEGKFGFRIAEFEAFTGDMNPVEYIFGRGMGGSYLPSVTTADVAKVGVSRGFHMGILFPLLKGGLILWLLYAAFFAKAFWVKPPGWYGNPRNAIAMSVLPMFIVSQLLIPMPTITGFLSEVVAAMGCARLTLPSPQEYQLDAYADYGQAYGGGYGEAAYGQAEPAGDAQTAQEPLAPAQES
jgi:hypothetical protein